MSEIAVVPPPWHLRGDGWVLFYWFDRLFVSRPGVLQGAPTPDRWRDGPGAVAIINYRESGVGPYGELLFVPGWFEHEGGRYFNVSKIYVETMASVVSGRANWGIPKDRADFAYEQRGLEEHWRVALDGDPLFEMTTREDSIRFPLNTSLFPLTLMQVWEGRRIFTPVTVRAQVSWMTLRDIRIDAIRFPDVSGRKPFAAVRLTDFAITFPVPREVPAGL